MYRMYAMKAPRPAINPYMCAAARATVAPRVGSVTSNDSSGSSDGGLCRRHKALVTPKAPDVACVWSQSDLVHRQTRDTAFTGPGDLLPGVGCVW
eukprot:6189584-Pleurochrysis_carterae.AAC.3